MGRKKIDTNCKLPERKINSTFTKRKRGAVNKAKQLGKLCDVDVALIAFHPRNDAVIAVSHGGRVDEIINKFHDFKQQHLEKVQFSEELRTQPRQLEQHQMDPNQMVPIIQVPPQHQMHPNQMDSIIQVPPQHQMHPNQMDPNTQVPPHLLPTFELSQTGIGMPMGQVEGFYIRAQGSPNGQQQMPQVQLLPPAPPPLDFQHNNYGQ